MLASLTKRHSLDQQKLTQHHFELLLHGSVGTAEECQEIKDRIHEIYYRDAPTKGFRAITPDAIHNIVFNSRRR